MILSKKCYESAPNVKDLYVKERLDNLKASSKVRDFQAANNA